MLTETQAKNGTSYENNLSSIATNGDRKVTISEAKAAGYKIPISKGHWLYQ